MKTESLRAYAESIVACMAAATSVGYVAGYLSLRARSFALGVEPGFTLVDEAYVFAGFRFFLLLLLVLFPLTPLLIGLNSGVTCVARRISARTASVTEWALLVGTGVLTLLSLRIFSHNGVLLGASPTGGTDSAFRRAILGGNPTFALTITILITALAASTAVWFHIQLRAKVRVFTWILGVVFALQSIMLPIVYGVIFADRRVHVLEKLPGIVTGMVEPAGTISRSSENVILMGCDTAGQPRLVTVKTEDLIGIPVTQIVPLWEFLQKLPAKTSSPAKAVNNSTLLSMVGEGLHVMFQNVGSLGVSTVSKGQIWIVELDRDGNPTRHRRWGHGDRFSWPIVASDSAAVFAIEDARVVRLTELGTHAETMNASVTWEMLLGTIDDGTVLGLAREGDVVKPAAIYPDGALSVSTTPPTEVERDQIALLLQEARAYDGGRIISIERSGPGFGVFLKIGDRMIRLSKAQSDTCSQPSLSPDFRTAAYILQPRY